MAAAGEPDLYSQINGVTGALMTLCIHVFYFGDRAQAAQAGLELYLPECRNHRCISSRLADSRVLNKDFWAPERSKVPLQRLP